MIVIKDKYTKEYHEQYGYYLRKDGDFTRPSGHTYGTTVEVRDDRFNTAKAVYEQTGIDMDNVAEELFENSLFLFCEEVDLQMIKEANILREVHKNDERDEVEDIADEKQWLKKVVPKKTPENSPLFKKGLDVNKERQRNMVELYKRKQQNDNSTSN